MRFSALVSSIFLGAVSAGPCRPSSVENSSETTGLIGVTTIESLSSTFAATVSTKPGGATTAAITSIVETTTESSAVAATTTAAASICNAPAALTCCQTVGTATNPVISLLLGLLGIVVQDPNTLLGATCMCSSITDPATCQATAVCCNDNSHGGLIAIGCSRV
ncbi:3-oxoacyl-[acyl-carrier-protein] reductase FabG [Fusarium oxysporum f. sp. albedinis]|nr:3-oxoacyl-[acyl-carrier-protein] reductase FabG [Fusarium oxysporum f. sp. albedinis]